MSSSINNSTLIIIFFWTTTTTNNNQISYFVMVMVLVLLEITLQFSNCWTYSKQSTERTGRKAKVTTNQFWNHYHLLPIVVFEDNNMNNKLSLTTTTYKTQVDELLNQINWQQQTAAAASSAASLQQSNNVNNNDVIVFQNSRVSSGSSATMCWNCKIFF